MKEQDAASGPKVYRIPVLWQMAGEVVVSGADLDLQKAIELAANMPTVDVWRDYILSHQGSPVKDSLSVDLEGVRIRYPDEAPPAVKHIEYDKPVPANEGEEKEPDSAHHCDERDTPPDRGYYCTRRVGHAGPHVAHFCDGQMIARWPSVQTDSGR